MLDVLVQSPTYDGGQPDPVPYIDAAGTIDAKSGSSALFLLNRDLAKPRQVEILWTDKAPPRVSTALVLTGNDLKATNSFDSPQQVHPQPLDKPLAGGSGITIELPPRSYSVIQLGA